MSPSVQSTERQNSNPTGIRTRVSLRTTRPVYEFFCGKLKRSTFSRLFPVRKYLLLYIAVDIMVPYLKINFTSVFIAYMF